MPPRQRHRLRYNTESDIYIYFRSSARIVRPRLSLFISFSRHREIPHCRSSHSSMWGRRAREGGGVGFSSFSVPPPLFRILSLSLSSPSPLAQSTPPKPLHHPHPHPYLSLITWLGPCARSHPPLTKTQPHVAMETTSSAPVGPCTQ